MTDLTQLRLCDYRPVPSLSAPSHRVERARTPVIDAHTHLGRWLTGGAWAVPSTTGLIELMDSCNVAAVVNMDGRDPPPTGRWCISGLSLPPEVLRLVYSQNARTLIPGLG
jgi:hypothetical protein